MDVLCNPACSRFVPNKESLYNGIQIHYRKLGNYSFLPNTHSGLQPLDIENPYSAKDLYEEYDFPPSLPFKTNAHPFRAGYD